MWLDNKLFSAKGAKTRSFKNKNKKLFKKNTAMLHCNVSADINLYSCQVDINVKSIYK